jgi:glutathione S-transferase
MKLHESPSPNARRVQVFLKEKGIPAPESVKVDIRAGENLSPEYRAKNPFGRVPALELDDGSFLTESVAICRYFEGLHPEPPLFGTTPLEQARIEMWNRRAELNFMSPVAQAFRNTTGIFKDREKISREWGEISAETAADALRIFDETLSGEFLAGDVFSVADITFGVALEFAEMVKVPVPLDLPKIKAYRERLAARKGFER